MGTDWHPYLETKQADGYWAPTWKPIPHPEWWYEDLLDRKLDDGSFALMWPKVPESLPTTTSTIGNVSFVTEQTTDADDDVLWKVARNYYRNMPMGEVVETIQASDMVWMWREHTDIKAWEEANELIRLNQKVPDRWDSYGRDRLSARDYDWFVLFGLRTTDKESVFDINGVPEDASPIVRRIYTRMKGDAHTPGHILVSDLFKMKGLSSYRQTKWLKRNITDPENTRLIFWFDN